MKNLRIALALVGVLAMTSAGYAEVRWSATRQADPVPGLHSWVVHV